jgi:hypothetical protein
MSTESLGSHVSLGSRVTEDRDDADRDSLGTERDK